MPNVLILNKFYLPKNTPKLNVFNFICILLKYSLNHVELKKNASPKKIHLQLFFFSNYCEIYR